MKKRFLSLALALVMCLGLLPAAAMAASGDKAETLYNDTYMVTFEIIGGTWADGSTDPITVEVHGNYYGYLTEEQIPTGMKNLADYKNEGSWYEGIYSPPVELNTSIMIDKDITYTYKFENGDIFRADKQILFGGGNVEIMYGGKYFSVSHNPRPEFAGVHEEHGFDYVGYYMPDQTQNFDFYGSVQTPEGDWIGVHGATVTVISTEDGRPFPDVKDEDYFYIPAMWGFAGNISDGVGDGKFGPAVNCNRAQIVTFLWKYAGSPEPKTTENPFTDIKPTDWYYKAVLWALENGITTGATKTTFAPGRTCSRAEAVTFLWKASGSPEPVTTENPFTDVKPTDWYCKAVLWAMENGITSGATETTFAPFRTCLRAEIMTFLYKTKQAEILIEE